MENYPDLSLFDQHDNITYNFDSNTHDLPILKDLDLPSNILKTSNNFSQNDNKHMENISMLDQYNNMTYNSDTNTHDLLGDLPMVQDLDLLSNILETFNNFSQTDKNQDMENNPDLSLFGQLDNIHYNFDTNTTKDDLSSNILKISNNFLQNYNDEVKENVSPKLRTLQYLPNQLHNENSTLYNVKYTLQDGKSIKIWECGFCKKLFRRRYMLMRHLPSHTKERKFKCLTCGKAFRQKTSLSHHKVVHFTERPYVCEICKKTYNRISTLISHRKTHTDPKRHRCLLCPKAFHSRGNLLDHIYTHTNEVKYKCDICGKGFIQMSNLMRHKCKAQQRNCKFICQVCGKRFPKMDVLRQHEHYHKMVTSSLYHSADKQLIDKTDYTNAIIIEPIETEAMRFAIESNQTPYALLHPEGGIPALVRILPVGNKQLLIPVVADNLRKHSHISVMPIDYGKLVGEIVKMQISIVAIIKQQIFPTSKMSVSVVNPGWNRELVDRIRVMSSKDGNYVYNSMLTNCDLTCADENIQDVPVTTEAFSPTWNVEDIIIEYQDESGNIIEENDFNVQVPRSTMNDDFHQIEDSSSERSDIITELDSITFDHWF